jgi:hypothetical protein
MALNSQPENPALKGLTPTDPAALPDLLAAAAKTQNKRYKVRYQKLNMDELGDIAELEKIETKVWQGEAEVYVLSKKEFVFMDKIFILIGYLEVDAATTAVPSATGGLV